MISELIPTFDKFSQKVIGIKIGNVEIPFKSHLLFQDFVDRYYGPLQISFQILDLSKISGEFKTEWTDEELRDFIQQSNDLQVIILNALRNNGSLTREGILQVIRQVDQHLYETFSPRQLGPQIGGIRIRINNMKKEDLILIDSKKESYSLNEKYRKKIKDILIDALKSIK